MPDSLHKVEQQLYERLERMRRDKMGQNDLHKEIVPIPLSEPLSAREKWEQELEERYNWSETMRPETRRWWNIFGIFGK